MITRRQLMLGLPVAAAANSAASASPLIPAAEPILGSLNSDWQKHKISLYRETAMYPLVEPLIEKIVARAVPNEIGIKVVSIDIADRYSKTVEAAFERVQQQLELKGSHIFERWFVDGTIAFEAQETDRKDEFYRFLDPRQLKCCHEINRGDEPSHKRYYIYGQHPTIRVIPTQNVVQNHSGLVCPNQCESVGHLHGIAMALQAGGEIRQIAGHGIVMPCPSELCNQQEWTTLDFDRKGISRLRKRFCHLLNSALQRDMQRTTPDTPFRKELIYYRF